MGLDEDKANAVMRPSKKFNELMTTTRAETEPYPAQSEATLAHCEAVIKRHQKALSDTHNAPCGTTQCSATSIHSYRSILKSCSSVYLQCNRSHCAAKIKACITL